MGIFLLWPRGRMNTYMAIFVKIDRHRMSGQFKRAGGIRIFDGHVFL